jgi:hypothetical protein
VSISSLFGPCSLVAHSCLPCLSAISNAQSKTNTQIHICTHTHTHTHTHARAHCPTQVDGLAHDAVMLDVRLHNTFNEFQMLANTQFIENRVFDEATESAPNGAADAKDKDKEKEKEKVAGKTREQREAEIMPKFKQALQVR